MLMWEIFVIVFFTTKLNCSKTKNNDIALKKHVIVVIVLFALNGFVTTKEMTT
jgi:hypothetical protein